MPFPGAMKLGGDGDIYFSQIQGGNPTLANLLAKYNPTTGVFTEIPVPTPFSSPGCDLNNQQIGKVWFGEVRGNRVGKFPADANNPSAVTLLNYWGGFSPYVAPPPF